MDFNPDTWGTVADWVGGLGTTAAFGVAASVVALDLRQRKRAQAEAISYHYQIADFTDLVVDDYRYQVRNDSGLPIHGIRLFDKADPQTRVSPSGPLLPGEIWTHRTTTWDRFTMPSLAFVDSAGRKWTKDVGGRRLREGWPWQTKKELRAWDKKVEEAQAKARAAKP